MTANDLESSDLNVDHPLSNWRWMLILSQAKCNASQVVSGYFFFVCYCDPKDIHPFFADLRMEADVWPLKYFIATPND